MSGGPDVLAMVRAGINTASAMFTHAYGARLPLAMWTPPVDARVTELHDAIQDAKQAGEIRLELGEREDGARSWWVAT